ncbi:hypothetical protein Bca52824_009631 [Brassica carinata]|uniref:DUF3741 domain-containing protein n=1 Tax=Brassica carinata TaxID=52824 RepID=A0A8X8BA25_BRACI|nr:hypothetical protein Bca52824_009631 [Brassica carinata]
MSAVFNIFDLQHLQFPINHHHLHLPKGVDAPRNSLESTEEEEETPCSPTRKDGNLNISMGIKIKTKPQARSSSSSLAATESYSPSVKTPTLVARLMGLDLVPENYRSSPTPSSSSSSLIDLKTTPRTSHSNRHRHYSPKKLCRRRHTFSSRHTENFTRKEISRRQLLTRVKEMKIHEDKENRSPRDYARQIVMQLKENVSRRRRMGTDITNKEQQQPRETHEPKKASKITITTHDTTSSPRLVLTEVPKTKPASSPHQTNNVPPKTLEVQEKTRLRTVQEEPQGYKKQSKSVKKCKKPENFNSRLVKPPQTMQEEPFVRSPATSNNNNNNGLLIQGDKSSLSINDLSKLQVDASSSQSSRNRAPTHVPRFQSQSSSLTHIAPIAGGELEYITRTLRRTGIDRDTPISYAKWFSPSHPLDPSIFYFLEHFAITSSRPRNSPEGLSPMQSEAAVPSNRRDPRRYPKAAHRSETLVAGDFPETAVQSGLAFEEEGEGIVAEIERGILEALVVETTTDCYDTWIKTAPLKRSDDVSVTWGVHVTRYPSKAGSHHDSWLRHPRG